MARRISVCLAVAVFAVVASSSSSSPTVEKLSHLSSSCANGECAADKAASLMQIQRQAIRKDQVEKEASKSFTDGNLSKRMRTVISESPCQCQSSPVISQDENTHLRTANWVAVKPRAPRCLFVDLGAADGNTYKQFLLNEFGDTRNCPSGGSHQAILVEANPIFHKLLKTLENGSSGRVKAFTSTAAYMCDGQTSFFLDTVDVQDNFWGSSMSPNARDVRRSGNKKVTVPAINIIKLIAENALPEDFVIVKMDLEGAEWDILPCLSKSPAARLIDALYVEKHPHDWALSGAVESDLDDSMKLLQARGVAAPEYNSPSL